jgi:peptidoglycan/xylan/chitin deacetylase (PgdA/CDA1 family)
MGSFLTADEVVAVARGNSKLEKNCFHLSFDDGFRNVITNAWPVLRQLGIPATFFVPTSVIGADYQVVEDYCLNVTNYGGVIEMASWDALARAQEEGLTIASHTRTHVRFSAISTSIAKMEDEIFGSKTDLEARLGRPCRYISWPYGRVTDADEKSLACVKKAGYEACFGAFRGRVNPGKTDPYLIPRHHFEPQWPISHLKYFANGGMERHSG